MQIGEIIKEYRKKKQITQEKMALILGVSAPAVNKWERGVSYPDIMLLAPIARLLGISTDILLSYQDELTDNEIQQKLRIFEEKMKTESYEKLFSWAMKEIQTYPNCYKLILPFAQVLDGYSMMWPVENKEQYEQQIRDLYERVLESDDRYVAEAALEALFHNSVKANQYGLAQEYLDRIPEQRINKNLLQAKLYRAQEKAEEAYELNERLIYQQTNELIQGIAGLYTLEIKEGDLDRAERLAKKQSGLARIMELSEYTAVSLELEVAVARKDKERTLEIWLDIAKSLKNIGDFRFSDLYRHLKFAEGMDISSLAGILKKSAEEEEDFEFVREDERFIEAMRIIDELNDCNL